MNQNVQDILKDAVKGLYGEDISIELTRPDEHFGDYSTNVALKLARKLAKPAPEIAAAIVSKVNSFSDSPIANAEIAGGFINLRLKSESLLSLAESVMAKPLTGKSVVVEYSDANPFKVLHAGHLYTSVIGDSIANLFASAGADVHRVNFGGDVGLHVAKSLWAMTRDLGGVNPDKLTEISPEDRADWLSERYIEGNQAFEENENSKTEIVKLNGQIYEIINSKDKDSALAKIYWQCRQWSYDYFDQFYNQLGIKFEKYYPESEVFALGLATVKEHIPLVYEESDGAVVFRGEQYGLFTNVFINSQGLPTYSAKDVGLIMQKWQEYHFYKSVVITDAKQRDYMSVVLKSIEQFAPELVGATTHLTHGSIKLKGGVKMSSRLGNFLKATDILDAAKAANSNKASDPRVTIGAVKYSFLKQAIGPDIIFDPEESVSLEGNSGPYLQYAHVRASNILSKAGTIKQGMVDENADLTEDERSLLLKISEFNEVNQVAIDELKPHYICTYLYELAQKFNSFYEKNRVLDDAREGIRLKLLGLYLDKLNQGLAILGIATPDKM